MKGKDLMEGLSFLDDSYVQEAEDAPDRKRRPGAVALKWGAVAACLCLLCVGAWQLGKPSAVEKSKPLMENEADGQINEHMEPPVTTEVPAETVHREDGLHPEGIQEQETVLVVDDWKEDSLYVYPEEQKGESVRVVMESGQMLPEDIKAGDRVAAAVTAWDREKGILYVSDMTKLDKEGE